MKEPNERNERENEVPDWETFQQKLVELRTKLGNVLFRGQGNSEWALTATLERSGKRAMWFFEYYHLITRIGPAVQTFAGAKAPEFSFVVRDSFEDQCVAVE